MFLADHLSQLIGQFLDGDASRFDELWHLLPDFPQQLRSFDDKRGWLHWTVKPVDGWYCVATEEGFEVYFQERGQIDGRCRFGSEQAAVRYAINAAIMPLPPAKED